MATTARGNAAAEPRSTVPTLLLMGDGDIAVTPKLATGFEHARADLRVEVMPGAAHFICDTHSQLVAARVREHLA